jgi:hypothetical protein
VPVVSNQIPVLERKTMKTVRLLLAFAVACIGLGITGCVHTHHERVVVERPVAPPIEVIVK